MNYKSLKKLFIGLPALLLVFLSGCVKEADNFVDLSKTSDFVILTGSGLGNVKASNIVLSVDTVVRTVTVNLAAKDNNNGAVTVTLGVDEAAIASYNSANGTSYQPFPADAYKLASAQLTVPAGEHYAETALEIYKEKLDPTISYMLPISITDAGGKNLSTNQNTIYYNIIGNPLGGSYTWDWYRFQAGDTTSVAPHSTSFEGEVASPIPSSATALVFPDDYLQTFADPAAGITLSFTNNAGTLSDFEVSFDQTTTDGLLAPSAGFTIASAPKLVAFTLAGSAANNYAGTSFRVYYSLINSTGAGRTFISNFVKQ